jgi:putative DNA primase/helicase
MTRSPLDFALGYARAGWPVVPCAHDGERAKQPLTPKATVKGAKDGGLYHATRDEAQIRSWWARWPLAMIGLRCGPADLGGCGATVIDLDTKEHPAVTMILRLGAFCGGMRGHDPETGEMLEPPAAQTQSGGVHVYYAALPFWPGAESGNRTDMFARLIKGGEAHIELAHIDARGAGGAGGYVIAPGSVLGNGRTYRWLRRPVFRDWRPVLPVMPERLAMMLRGEIEPAADIRARDEAKKAAQRFSRLPIDDARVRRFVEVCTRRTLERMASTTAARSDAIWNAACSLSAFVKSGHLARSDARALLVAHLPAGVAANESKALDTIERGLNADRVPAFQPAQLRGERA